MRRSGGRVEANPLFGFQAGGFNLVARQKRVEGRNAVFARFVVARSSQQRPEVGLPQIFWNTSSSPIIRSESVLGDDVSLLGGFRKPTGGFDVVELNAVADRVMGAKSKLSGSIATFGGDAQLVERRC